MLELPIIPWMNQNFLVQIEDQDCAIDLYQRGQAMYLDLQVDGEMVCQGSLCQSGVGIVQNANNRFSGQLIIIDTLSADTRQETPNWKSLGERWKLYWLSPEEVAEIRENEFLEAQNG